MYAAQRPIPPQSHRARRVEPARSTARWPTEAQNPGPNSQRRSANRDGVLSKLGRLAHYRVRTPPRPCALGAERPDSTFCGESPTAPGAASVNELPAACGERARFDLLRRFADRSDRSVRARPPDPAAARAFTAAKWRRKKGSAIRNSVCTRQTVEAPERRLNNAADLERRAEHWLSSTPPRSHESPDQFSGRVPRSKKGNASRP